MPELPRSAIDNQYEMIDDHTGRHFNALLLQLCSGHGRTMLTCRLHNPFNSLDSENCADADWAGQLPDFLVDRNCSINFF